MIRFTKYSQSDKYSFLNNLLPDSYEYAKVFRPWALIYAILLITTLILSHFFYSSVIEFFVRAMMGWSILNILFVGVLIVILDIQVKPITAIEEVKGKTPLRYKASMVWACSLCIAGIVGLYISNQYKKDYMFKCLDFYLEEPTGIYHISRQCPYIGMDEDDNPIEDIEASWVKGYELEDRNTLCGACKEAAEDAAAGY